MRLSLSSSSLLATFLLSLPHLGSALQANLAGVIDWHQPKIGIPLLHSSVTAPSFVPLPSIKGDSSSIVTITKSNVFASLNSTSGDINWRHQLPTGEIAQSYHSSPSPGSIVLLSTTLEGGFIRLVDSTTGHFIWETAFTTSSDSPRDAEVSSLTDVAFGQDGSLFVLVDASDVYKLDGKTGSIVWSHKTGGNSVWSRLVLSSNHLSLIGSVNTFTGYALKTLRLNPSTAEIITSPGHSGSIDSPTSFLVSGSDLVWLEDNSIYTLSLETSSPKPRRTLSAFTSLQSLGLEKEGYFLGFRRDGQAETLKSTQGEVELAYTFSSNGERSRETTSIPTYNGFVDVSGAAFVAQTLWSHTYKYAAVSICSFKGDGSLSGHTFSFEPASHGEILHTAFYVDPSGGRFDLKGPFITTSTGAVQLHQGGRLQFTREESLSEIKSVVFVDLPEQEVLQQASRDDEPFADRLLRHVVEARHLPAYLARFVSRLVSSSSAASVLTTSPSTSTEDGLFRDQFGFRKLLVVGTSTGKVFGLDSSNGNIVWSKLLGKSVVEGGSLDILGVFVTRPAKTGLKPRVTIVGSSVVDNEENTVAFEIDSLSGDILTQAPALFGGRPSEVIPLVVGELVGKSLAVLDKDSLVHFFPRPPTAVEAQDFVVTRAIIEGGKQSLAAFRVSTNASPAEVWRLPFAEGEAIYSIESTSQDPVASFGRILGDRSALYKYLNPHLLAVSTISPSTSQGTVYLVDGTRGTIVYQVSHANLDTSAGIELSLLENWLVYRYRAEGLVATAGVSTGNRVVTVELFERGVAADKIGSSELTSYSAEHDLNILSKTFILPSGIKAIGTTSTKHGITSKEVIIADNRNQLHSIPRRLLDPRRPHGKPSALDREEQLVPYDPIINLDPKRTLSHAYELLGVSSIVTSPALLESTSLVFAYGLDLFSTRVMPSGTFDILSDSFNKAQLLLTIMGLSVGIVAVKPIVERKKSKAKWF
ncbi:hypothetical protein BDY24DRAFT_393298 [Mrakia frigida]|uniref:uncharacterized protein n=1 Tax=Mrakia frigida TaxID=29902 RepID=UPI003FCC0DF0